MPDLKHCLRNQDLGFLNIVADFWGIELHAPDANSALAALLPAMQDEAFFEEVVESLPKDARSALDQLKQNQGRLSWSRFIQQFGPLREVGPGKRDREKPYLDPVSTTEVLWYRGLIGRDFLRQEGLLQECAYLPDRFLDNLSPAEAPAPMSPGRAASPGETAHIQHASDRILDHTCTLLAALRLEDAKRSPALRNWRPPYDMVYALLAGLKLITSSEQPVPEDARPFLEMPRGKALAWLVQGWRMSDQFNELHLVPKLICEGAWHNNPRKTREMVLSLLSQIPEGRWWNLPSFIHHVHEYHPDFQRPAGEFDTWLIRSAETGESLMGLSHWLAVDGALLRYLITGPMHWLGLIDLAGPKDHDEPAAFRFSPWAADLLLGKPVDLLEESTLLKTSSDGQITASTHTPRLVRYQVARFCLWQKENHHEYIYQLSPESLKQAAAQGLKIAHLQTLLERYGETTPPSLTTALQHWDQQGRQVQIQPGVVLRVSDPKILQALRSAPAGRFVGDPLGPTAAIIHPEAIQKITAALARLGYLSDVILDPSCPNISAENEPK